MRRIRAYVVRDFQLEVSYRFAFLLRVLSVLGVVTTFFFVSQIFTGGVDCPCANSPFAQWRDPLAAWITGLAVLNYFMTGFSSLANAIRSEQAQGTLEATLMTPISITTLVVASSAWDFVQATFYSSLYFFFGWSLFGVRFRGSFLLAFAILLLTTLVLASVGILSASFAMVFKRGDPFAIFLGTGSAIFSGVFFPTQLLGSGFNRVSRALPPTYGLDGIRGVLIEGRGFSDVREPIFTLIIFLAVLLPFSVWVFSRAVRRAKREGSLIQY
jgi:ABC-2 type transport system permease protein